MPKTKQQPDNEQIKIEDPNDPDVVAYGAIGSQPEPACGVGEVWDGQKCVPISPPEQ